jgi:hypothetical protein
LGHDFRRSGCSRKQNDAVSSFYFIPRICASAFEEVEELVEFADEVDEVLSVPVVEEV